MEIILFINACVRAESRTLRLARAVLENLKGNITELRLEDEQIAPLTGRTLEERTAHLNRCDYSQPMLRYARQFAEADTIVIAAPYWDLSFPASLKAYFEAVNSMGITFHYVDDMPQSLCRAKRLIYVMTAGGEIYANHGFEYVKSLCKIFYKIPETICFAAENLDVTNADVEKILEAAIEEVHNRMKQ